MGIGSSDVYMKGGLSIGFPAGFHWFRAAFEGDDIHEARDYGWGVLVSAVSKCLFV